jgi:hypothetical protein
VAQRTAVGWQSRDGVVFLGDYGPWYSPEHNQYHLSRDAAAKLLAGTLKTYEELEGKPLKEIFLHSRSAISTEEFEGYKSACPSGVKLVGIRIQKDFRGVRMYREGSRPVLRGTSLKAAPRLELFLGFWIRPALANISRLGSSGSFRD